MVPNGSLDVGASPVDLRQGAAARPRADAHAPIADSARRWGLAEVISGDTSFVRNAARLHGRVSSPECNCACQGSRPCPHSMAIIAALHNPLTILLADDLADVVTPYDDGPD